MNYNNSGNNNSSNSATTNNTVDNNNNEDNGNSSGDNTGNNGTTGNNNGNLNANSRSNNFSNNNSNRNPNNLGGPADTTDISKPQEFEINFSLDKVKSTHIAKILHNLDTEIFTCAPGGTIDPSNKSRVPSSQSFSSVDAYSSSGLKFNQFF